MSELQLRHVATMLKQRYSGKIDVSDCLTAREEDVNNLFLTRAYAAYSLQVIADVPEDTAANSITDGINDNGIDAILFDKSTKILWIVQSKWKKKGEGEPESGDTLKFCSGIKKIIEDDFESFNDKVKSKQCDIEEALNDYTVKINIILAYTGGDNLSSHNLDAITRLLQEVNEDSEELMSFETFTLSKAHKALAGLVDGQPINTEMVINSYGKIDEPYKAIYGYVNGTTFAQLWDIYKSRLFSENIRGFLGDSIVNDDVQATITNCPETFYYFNNGVTILCDAFNKKPLMQQNAGTFDVKNLKIVNGAQTVGNIGKMYKTYPDAIEKVWVTVKLISLENCPPDFGENVTRKTNTQNKIEKRDFVSLDFLQDKLKTELALLGVNYHIKRSGDLVTDEMSCTVDELMIAVACSLSDIDYAVMAKREVGLLWNDTKQAPYTLIINENLTAIKAWRCVQVMRRLNTYIKRELKQNTGRKRLCIIHSNRFVLHIILNKIVTELENENLNFGNYLDQTLDSEIFNIEKRLYKLVEKKYKSSLIHQVFRNFTKCRELKILLLK